MDSLGQQCNAEFNFSTNTKSSRTLIMDQHQQSYLIKCLLCSDSFDSTEKFEVHECKQRANTVLSGDNPLNSTLSLVLHDLVHKRGSVYECENCKGFFTDQLDFENHVQAHHQENTENEEFVDKKLYECDDCKKLFNRKSDLTLHIRSHVISGCENSKESFAQPLNLANNMTDSKTNANVREVRDKYFLRKSTLHEDTKIHSKENPLKRDKSFVKKGILTKNSGIHTRVKPYKCKHNKSIKRHN